MPAPATACPPALPPQFWGPTPGLALSGTPRRKATPALRPRPDLWPWGGWGGGAVVWAGPAVGLRPPLRVFCPQD